MSWQPAEQPTCARAETCDPVDLTIEPSIHDLGGFEVRRILPASERRKIALFCNVRESSVIQAADVESIYDVPVAYHEEGLDYVFQEKVRSSDGAVHDTGDGVGAYQSIEEGRESTVSCACHWTVNVAASAGHTKIFGDAYSISPSGIFVPENSKIRSPEELAKVPISVGFQSGSHYSTIQALEHYLDPEQIKLDENGIPILQHAVRADELSNKTASANLSDHEQIAELLREEAIQQVLNDITEDLQKLVAWKIESLLKEEFARLIRDATEQSASKMAEDIRTHLQLALPDLLARIAKQAQG